MGDHDPISNIIAAIFVKWRLRNNLKRKRDTDTIFAEHMHQMKG